MRGLPIVQNAVHEGNVPRGSGAHGGGSGGRGARPGRGRRRGGGARGGGGYDASGGLGDVGSDSEWAARAAEIRHQA